VAIVAQQPRPPHRQKFAITVADGVSEFAACSGCAAVDCTVDQQPDPDSFGAIYRGEQGHLSAGAEPLAANGLDAGMMIDIDRQP